MYQFKKDKYLELLNGKTVEWLSKEVGYTPTTLYLLFNGHKTCKKALAIALLAVLNKDYDINDFFDKVDEGE